MQLAGQYVLWHYSRGVRDCIVLWSNIIWFLSHFFSLSLLSSTLFSPWKRLQERRSRGMSFEDILSSLVVNLLMRIVGFSFRITMIAIGLIFLAIAFLLMIVHVLLWILLPAIVPIFLYYGVVLLVA